MCMYMSYISSCTNLNIPEIRGANAEGPALRTAAPSARAHRPEP